MKKTNYIKLLLITIALSTIALAQNENIPEGAWVRKVKVAMMGDMFVIESPEGLDEVSLICAQAPQLKPDGKHEPMAAQARNFSRAEVEGKEVTLVFDNPKNTPKKGADGRYMAYMYYTKQADPKSEPATLMLNAELIKNGLARVDTAQQCSLRAEMYDYQRIARRDKLGIWAEQK